MRASARAVLIAAAIGCVANVWMIVGAASNRRTSDSELTLTSRELRLDRQERDATATFVRLEWMQLRGMPGATWFDSKKLAAIGYDVSVPPADQNAEWWYRRQKPKVAYAVLEFDGPIAATFPRQQLHSSNDRPDAPPSATRLIVVDAGNDAAMLRQRYPDRSRYLISRADVRIKLGSATPTTPAHVFGEVGRLFPYAIQVPAEHAAALRAFGSTSPAQASGFTMTIRYGRKLEPWVARVKSEMP